MVADASELALCLDRTLLDVLVDAKMGESQLGASRRPPLVVTRMLVPLVSTCREHAQSDCVVSQSSCAVWTPSDRGRGLVCLWGVRHLS